MATLKVKNLFKHYRNAKYISARNISFEVKEGEIFGFLGINGAGKSTTIKCITGIIPFTSGQIEVVGNDITDKPHCAKKNFGFVPDNHAVYDKLTGVEYVNYLADLYDVSKDVRKSTFDMLVDKFNMRNAVNNQIASYSHGMKQKISIIGALIHSPKLWILDEPMVGLDPQSIFEVKEYMKEYAKAGNSVFFSSHNLDTVERLCDRAVIVHGGRLIRDIDLHEYRKTGKDLEKEFIELTKAATATQNKQRAELGEKEDALAKEYGKMKANKMIIKQVKAELDAEIAASVGKTNGKSKLSATVEFEKAAMPEVEGTSKEVVAPEEKVQPVASKPVQKKATTKKPAAKKPANKSTVKKKTSSGKGGKR